MREVDPHAQLARVAADEVRALVVSACFELEKRAAHLVALAGQFDLDDPRAEVG